MDVTKQRAAEKELGRYREHLEELVETRTAKLKTLNEQLQLSENRYRFLLDNITVRIFYKDKNSVYLPI